MFNLYQESKIAEMRCSERLKEAESARLIKEIRADRSRPLGRFLMGSGNLLITLGQKLKERHEPAVRSETLLGAGLSKT